MNRCCFAEVDGMTSPFDVDHLVLDQLARALAVGHGDRAEAVDRALVGMGADADGRDTATLFRAGVRAILRRDAGELACGGLCGRLLSLRRGAALDLALCLRLGGGLRRLERDF